MCGDLEILTKMMYRRLRPGRIAIGAFCSISLFESPTNLSLIAGRAAESNCRQVQDALIVYEHASGQRVNLEKSETCFNINVKRPVQLKLAEILRVNHVDRHEKYLGMPTLVGRNMSMCFGYLKDHLWKRLKSWKGKILSAVEK
ncbi:hypothetical protein ACFX2I_037087 [Malus domestica]